MDTTPQPRTTTAFYVQSIASFALSLTAVAVGTSVPAAQRDELFATLVKRTSENAL